MKQYQFTINTQGRGSYEFTSQLQTSIKQSNIETGMCHVFIHHTSASLMLCENADPDVRRDLDAFMLRLVPDGDPLFTHQNEGPDDMPAHVRTVLTQTGISIPISAGRCALGTWQGIYVWEHRTSANQRQVTVSTFE